MSCTKNNRYVFKKGKSKIEMTILNGEEYLIYDQPTRVNFKWENIDVKTTSIFGAGIKILSSENNTTKTEITVSEDYLVTDTLIVKVNYTKRSSIVSTKFKIPLIKS